MDRMLRVTGDEPIEEQGTIAPEVLAAAERRRDAARRDNSGENGRESKGDARPRHTMRRVTKLAKRLMQKKLLKDRERKKQQKEESSPAAVRDALYEPHFRKWIRMLLYDMHVKSRIPLHLCTEGVMRKLAQMPSSSGYMAVMKKPEYSFKKLLESNKMHKIVVCDRIVDPGNLGTIIRNAVAYQYDAIVTTPNTVHAFNDKVIRSSAGAVFKIPVVESVPMDHIVKSYVRRVNGYTAYIATSDKFERVWDISNDASRFVGDLSKTQNRHLLWLSNETDGVSNELNELIPRGKGKRKSPYYNRIIEVNVDTKMESINVAVASGILMHKVREYLEVTSRKLNMHRESQRKRDIDQQPEQLASGHVPFFELDSKKTKVLKKQKLAGRIAAPKKKATFQLTRPGKGEEKKRDRHSSKVGGRVDEAGRESRAAEREARGLFGGGPKSRGIPRANQFSGGRGGDSTTRESGNWPRKPRRGSRVDRL